MTQKKQTVPFLTFRSGEGLGTPEAGFAIIRYNYGLGRIELSLDGGPYQGLGGGADGYLFDEFLAAPIVPPILDGYLAYIDYTSTELNKISVDSLLALLSSASSSLQAAYEAGNSITTSAADGSFSVSGTEDVLLSSDADVYLTALGSLTLGAGGQDVLWPALAGAAGTVLTNDGSGNLSWSAPAGGGSVTSVTLDASTTGLTVSGGSSQTITSSGTFTLGGTLAVANGGTGTSTALTPGSVVFAGASGVYSQDNANLFWDDANNYLGIGTSSPLAPVTVLRNQDAGTSINVYNSSTGLFAQAALYLTQDSSNYGGLVHFSTGSLFAAGRTALLDISTNGVTLVASNGAGSINFITGALNDANERMRITATGNVGIGTTTPTANLQVNGNSATVGQSITNTSTTGVSYLNLIEPATGGNVSWQYRNQASATAGLFTASQGLLLADTGATGGLLIGSLSTSAPIVFCSGGFLAANERLRFGSSEVGVNGNGENVDFRVESAANANMLFVDASANAVGIATVSPTTALSVAEKFQVNDNGNILKINNVATSFPALQGAASTVLTNDGLGNLSWSPAASGTISGSGTATQIAYFSGASSIGSETAVGSDSFTWDAANNRLGVGTSTPTSALHVQAGDVGIIEPSATASHSFYLQQGAQQSIGFGYRNSSAGVGGVLGNSQGTILSDANATGGIVIAAVEASAPIVLAQGGNPGLTANVERLRADGTEVVVNKQQQDIDFRVATTAGANGLFVEGSSGNVGIGTSTPSADLTVEKSAVTVSSLTKNTSSGAAAQSQVRVAGNTVGVEAYLAAYGSANGNSSWGILQNNGVALYAGSAQNLFIGTTGDSTPIHIGTNSNTGNARAFLIAANGGPVTANPDGSPNVDFVVQSDTNTHMLFVDASANVVGISTASPTATFSVAEKFQVDSNGNILKINNVATSWPATQGSLNSVLTNDGSGNLAWVSASSQNNTAPIATKTANYTMTSSDGTVLVDASSGAITITLPAAASSAERIFTIKKKDVTANIVTVDANASELIDGSTTYPLSTQYEAIKIQSDGTAWWII